MNISFEEGLAVLEALARSNCPSTISQISLQTRFDEDTIQNTLRILEMTRYVSVSRHSSRVALSPKLWSLGFCLKDPTDLKRVAERHLSKLAMETRESACLAVIADKEIVIAAGINAPEPTVTEFDVGTKVPARHCAAGKSILAFQSLQIMREFETSVFEVAREKSDVEAFRRELELIRARGYAIEFGEAGGMRCEVAAPIRCADGVIEAAVGISGPSNRLTSEVIPVIAENILEAAEEISRELNYLSGGTAFKS
ncbi:IclR family transcriptional regulator [Bosea sp. RAF48]|uniref:IclR family transcriptional regulator n=1 Tax=Bosea sp. RAF48 TaxID=3237480 RepID=UPI003F8DD9CA